MNRWTDEHTSEQMLAYHLDPDVDVSSRRADFIDRSVQWMASRFGIGAGTRIADFGCGPGLYTNRLAGLGANVTGIDFSKCSIRHARDAAAEMGVTAQYVNRDYLHAFSQREEVMTYGEDLLDGFWSAERYYGFLNTFKYEDAQVVLDKYTIVESARTRTIYNWLQYFSPESLRRDFEEAGFPQPVFYADVTGTAFDHAAPEFAVTAGKA